jgi:hypothetical protein
VAKGDLSPRLKQKFIIEILFALYIAVPVEVESDLAIGRKVSLLP